MTETPYTPKGCDSLASLVGQKQQIRLGIQGYPGTGKTWAALTFPNPIVINLDRGLGAHVGRADVIEVPFYKAEFSGAKHELKDRLVRWLETEGPRLGTNQTLVFDGCTELEKSYHIWFEFNKLSFLTKAGKVDEFAEYQVKKKYFGELHQIFKTLKCDVVFLSHEYERADKPTTIGQPGAYTGKIRPLLTGAYGDMIVGDYTDWFRQHSAAKPTDYKLVQPSILKLWGMKTIEEYKSICDSFPNETIYYWQTIGDDKFDGKASSLVGAPMYIPANYNSFNNYTRKIT